MNYIHKISIIFLTINILPTASPQHIELISKQMDGKAAGLSSSNTFFTGLDISYDGRYVVFSSASNNIVPGDTNHYGYGSDYNSTGPDIFLYDRKIQSMERISVKPDGTQLNHSGSSDPSISADGAMIAYRSDGADEFPGDPYREMGDQFDVFVYHHDTQLTELVSKSITGKSAEEQSLYSTISGDGKHISFISYAMDLRKEDVGITPKWGDIYEYDILTHIIKWCSPSKEGKHIRGDFEGEFGSSKPTISFDGQYIAFVSNNSFTQEGVAGVFVRDTSNENTQLVSRYTDGTPILGGVYGFGVPLISDDGRYVFFTATTIPTLPPPGTEFPLATIALIVKDLKTGNMELLPFFQKNNNNEIYRIYSGGPVAFSATGRYVAFVYSHRYSDLYTTIPDQLIRYDRNTGELRVLLNAHVFEDVAITPDGKTIAFSTDSPLVPEDENPLYNFEGGWRGFDVYVLELEDTPPAVMKWDEHP